MAYPRISLAVERDIKCHIVSSAYQKVDTSADKYTNFYRHHGSLKLFHLSILQALLDAGVLANALSTLNRAASYHQHHFQMEVAKLVMWITMAGFGKDVVHEQARCFGVLLKKVGLMILKSV